MERIDFTGRRSTHARRIGGYVCIMAAMWAFILLMPSWRGFYVIRTISLCFWTLATIFVVPGILLMVPDAVRRERLALDPRGIAFGRHRFAWSGIHRIEVVKSLWGPAIRLLPEDDVPPSETVDLATGDRRLGEMGRDIVFDEWEAGPDDLIEAVRRFHGRYGPPGARGLCGEREAVCRVESALPRTTIRGR